MILITLYSVNNISNQECVIPLTTSSEPHNHSDPIRHSTQVIFFDLHVVLSRIFLSLDTLVQSWVFLFPFEHRQRLTEVVTVTFTRRLLLQLERFNVSWTGFDTLDARSVSHSHIHSMSRRSSGFITSILLAMKSKRKFKKC